MTKAPQGKAGSASDVFNPVKKALSQKAMQTTLKRYQVELNQPERHPQKTTSGSCALQNFFEIGTPARSN